MPSPEIRVMAASDVDFAMSLIRLTGWGNTRDDVLRSLAYEPHGCFVASVGGEDVGIVNSFLYSDIGYIGNLIVSPESRSGGVGAALMSHALRRLSADGARTVRLDAVQKAIPLYQRLGFVPEYWSLRFTGIARVAPSPGVKPMSRGDLTAVSELDRRYFGLNREHVLLRVHYDFPALCFVADDAGELAGFIMARLGETTVRVGPWISDPEKPEVAEALFDALSSKVSGQRLWVGVPESNAMSSSILEARGLSRNPPSLRMYHGQRVEVGDIKGIFGIGAPDKG